MTVVVKLGGSVITDKSQPETVDAEALATAAAALDTVDPEEAIVVHGGGSFGHPAAARHEISREVGTRDIAAILDVTGAMRRLNDRVIAALHEHDVPALRVQPLAMAERVADGSITCSARGLRRIQQEGFLPVLHGDLIGHEGQGCSVVSGDELTVALGRTIGADRLGFCSAVPGVLDQHGTVIDRIEDTESLPAAVTGADDPDVTGGMAAKVESLAACGIPAAIFDLASLPTFLAGNMPGTTIG